MGGGPRHAVDKRHLRERATAGPFRNVDVVDVPLVDRRVGLLEQEAYRNVPALNQGVGSGNSGLGLLTAPSVLRGLELHGESLRNTALEDHGLEQVGPLEPPTRDSKSA